MNPNVEPQHQPAPQALSLHSLHERVQRIERSLGISSENVTNQERGDKCNYFRG
ncbi:hypothetical protein CIHG_03950 [Coccidioides immitis H538.4]|uniref:Uncharacterized protein n=1 Tax=Coccidioides immitis H538.4 TaxID=396776 RepID=A0A0J8RN05_COCIT|nr:hypothetical protein CIHG_03950 [Coccidioides immitis H538.4]